MVLEVKMVGKALNACVGVGVRWEDRKGEVGDEVGELQSHVGGVRWRGRG